jgi:hypothetical protein
MCSQKLGGSSARSTGGRSSNQEGSFKGGRISSQIASEGKVVFVKSTERRHIS